MSERYGTGRLHTKSIIDWEKAVEPQRKRQTEKLEEENKRKKTNNQTPTDEPPETR